MYQRAGVKLHHGWMPNAPTGGLLVRPGANTGVCARARDGGMARLEVLTGPERRRRWSVEQKQAIVVKKASLSPRKFAALCAVVRALR